MTDRNMPSWIYWGTAVFLFFLIGYPVSYGPAASVYLNHDIIPPAATDLFLAMYYPIDAAFEFAPEPIRETYDNYFEWWTGFRLSVLNQIGFIRYGPPSSPIQQGA